MIDRRITSTLLVTASAAFLAACSSGATSLTKPSKPLAVEPLAGDDPLYRQARLLMEVPSEDGQWIMNLVERGHGTFRERHVVLVDAEAGKGYALPQLADLVVYPQGEWTDEDRFVFTTPYTAVANDGVLAIDIESGETTDAIAVSLLGEMRFAQRASRNQAAVTGINGSGVLYR